MNTRKIIVASAAALALVTLVVAIVQPAPPESRPAPPAGGFSTRLQPQLPVNAGTGSTRNLTPVPLGGPEDPPPAPAPSRTQQASSDGGRRATAESKR